MYVLSSSILSTYQDKANIQCYMENRQYTEMPINVFMGNNRF